MKKTTTLSVTETETVSGVTCAQEMMYAKNIVESVGLEVELPMILEVGYRGTMMDQNFASSGRTKHMEIRMLQLEELQEREILDVRWIKGGDNETDIQIKNVSGPDFNKHNKVYHGEDMYS